MGNVMHLSFTASLDTNRAAFPLGRVSAHSAWRPEPNEMDREIAMRALVREAEEYGADGVVEVAFETEECPGVECECVKLRRVVATGRAVKLALAA
jgi:uncharacterized protein YbjQ (UPF0145 family)